MDIGKKTVGVVGGGQLGRMMAYPAHRLGVKLICLDAAGPESPCAKVRLFEPLVKVTGDSETQLLRSDTEITRIPLRSVDFPSTVGSRTGRRHCPWCLSTIATSSQPKSSTSMSMPST